MAAQIDNTGPASPADKPGPRIQLNLFKLVWPTAANQILLTLVSLAAIKIVGGLGNEAVASVVVGGRIYLFLQTVTFALSMGTSAIVARCWGARNHAEADAALKASLVLGIASALVILLAMELFGTALIDAAALDAAVARQAAEYLRILVRFHTLFTITILIGAALRAAGDTLTPLMVSAAGNVLNVALAFGLVYGRFGLPELGVNGAAVASGTAYLFTAVALWLLWISNRLVLKPLKTPFYSKARMAQIVRISAPVSIELIIFNSSTLVFLWFLSLYGTFAISAYGMAVNVLSLSMLVGYSFTIAASTLVGQQLGAGQPEEAVRATWKVFRAALISMVTITALITLNGQAIGAFLLDDPRVVDDFVVIMLMLTVSQPLLAVEYALSGALRGAGDTKSPAAITALSFVFGRLLFCAIFYKAGLSVFWIYASLIADYIIKSALYLARFRSGKWQTALPG